MAAVFWDDLMSRRYACTLWMAAAVPAATPASLDAILEAQMDVAVEMERNVSVHSVKSQQATVELLNRMQTKHGDAWNIISVDMHSCGLSSQTWRSIEVRVFLVTCLQMDSSIVASESTVTSSSRSPL